MSEAEKTQSDDIGKLILALSRAQNEFEGANKSADNPFFKSKYADLHECITATKEPLAKNELAVIQTTELSDNGIVIVTTLGHSSGQWIKGKIKMIPKKDDDQGRGSSITYARRYCYAAIVGLAQKDDDGNGSCKLPENKTAVPKEKEISIEERFSKAIDWITGQGKKEIDPDQFDLAVDSMRPHLSIFKGRMKKDIEATIADTRKFLEEKVHESN